MYRDGLAGSILSFHGYGWATIIGHRYLNSFWLKSFLRKIFANQGIQDVL